MKVYMRKKRNSKIVSPDVSQNVSPPCIVKRYTVIQRPDYSHIIRHNKQFRKVLRHIVWLVWLQGFDQVMAEFGERKNAYMEYHGLD
jgi:hypothetical protein